MRRIEFGRIMAENKNPLEKLMDDWEKDSPIDRTEPGKEVSRIPNLHAKYARELYKNSLLLKKFKTDHAKILKKKSDYYSGRMDEEELQKFGLKPFKFMLKDDILKYIEADEEIINIKLKIALYEEMVAFLTAVLRQLNDRTYQMRAFIDWEKFIGGQ